MYENNYEQINRAIIECLCREYQAVWVVDTEDYSMHPFMQGKDVIPKSVDTAAKMDYEFARKWYINTYIVEEDRDRVLEMSAVETVIREVLENETYTVDYKRLNGDRVNYNQLYYGMLNKGVDKVRYFVMGFRDIDRRRKADIDDLTGVYTRRAFFRRASKALQENPDEVYDLMISDIVDFKQINETYGVKVGDQILAYMGSKMVPENSNGTIVGRYGGDQFVVLIKHDRMLKMREVPENLLIKPGENMPKYITKFGIYEFVDRDLPIVAMCDYAHIALNSIKHKYGSLFALYNDTFAKGLENQRRIEASMHQALSEEQFKVYYQPKHEAISGKIIGAEALIRWIHPEYGFMSPGDFIPLFEQNGFVTETDMYVWKRTCKNLRRWKDKGLNVVPISVNASKLDFVQTDIIGTLNEYVAESEISPELIHVEVTESLMEEDINKLTTTLSDIKKGGYKIELDDFGSGYSSINILSTIPIDVVKLDMSFVQQLNDTKRAKVLSACISLAKNLGYETVSEGVETKEQNEMLKVFGVDSIQGYYYSRPLPEDEFEEYLAKNA